jgi:hypothetical protein
MKSRQAEYGRSTALHHHSDEEAMSLRAPYVFHAAPQRNPLVNLNSRLKLEDDPPPSLNVHGSPAGAGICDCHQDRVLVLETLRDCSWVARIARCGPLIKLTGWAFVF